MKRSLIILYSLLLLVPTAFIGTMSLRLLRHEGERVNLSAREAARMKVNGLAEHMALAVRDAEDGLSQALLDLGPHPDLEPLLEMERVHPLVRNVFSVDSSGAVRWPNSDAPLTREEQAFLDRYRALLDGRVAWDQPEQDRAAPPSVANNTPFQPVAQADQVDSRVNLKQWAQYGQNALGQQVLVPGPYPLKSGWTPWFWEDGLYLLGWVQGPDRATFGAELETASLFARLTAYLPTPEDPATAFAVLDGSGHIFHQVGGFEVRPGMEPMVSAPIGSALPHWQVGLYHNGSGSVGARAVSLASFLLVGVFIAVLLSSGSLLIVQAHRNLKDARRKTSFVSNVSHELKTPLTTIRMYAELLGENRVSDPERRRGYLAVIIDESQRLTRLVNNVLDFGRLEQRHKQYHREPLDAAEVTAAVVDTQRPRIEQAGLDLELDPNNGPITVMADRDALEQALLNLLDNAIKYAADGKRIEVGVQAVDSRVLIRVRDYGPGIARGQRERIFDTFHRVDDSLTARTQGSGLGLTIARRLMRDLGGDLACRTTDGPGILFELTLPLCGHSDKEARS